MKPGQQIREEPQALYIAAKSCNNKAVDSTAASGIYIVAGLPPSG